MCSNLKCVIHMNIKQKYQPRPICYLELFYENNWRIKIYSISSKKERVNEPDVLLAKKYVKEWLKRTEDYQLPTYNIATLILHEWAEGVFAVINWWIDENMLQNFVYLKKNNQPHFELYSGNGMATCVWEMAIWWHERNAWVKHVLMKNKNPDMNSYLQDILNEDL